VAGDYFMAAHTLRWPVIGMALFATNISCVHLISLAQSGYDSGLLNGNFEWMASITLILLGFFLAPFYLKSKVATLPDFLERRYCRECRDWLAVISIFAAIIFHIAFPLAAGWLILHDIFGIGKWECIFLMCLLTGIYTVAGGLAAVAITETIQTIVLLLGAFILTAFAWMKTGGWTGMLAALEPAAGMAQAGTDSQMMSMLRPHGDASGMPWYAIFLGYPVLGIWYWCADQTIVQRVLAAKDERHARLGPLFCAFLKIWPVFLFVLPGVICLALVQQGVFGTEAPATPADTFTFLVTHLLPTGLKGLVLAALLAAAMQTCSAALNSTATLVSYDIFKRYRPDIGDHRLVQIGKVTTVAGTVLAIVFSPMFGHYSTLFEGINKLITYVAPPITAVFVWGVFWKGASGRAAFVTLITGMALGAVAFWIDWNNIYRGDFMMIAFLLFLLCSAILIIVSLIMPEPVKEEALPLIWQDWREPLRGEAGGHGLGNYRLASIAVVAVFAVLYFVCR
jgi:SSS family solute:Na+ symporter